MLEQEESPKKPTFYDLRIKHGGNIGQLAQASGIDGRSIHAMLLNRGVTRADAEGILSAFNRLNDTAYRLDDLQVHLVEQYQERQPASADTRPTFRQLCERCAVAWIDLSRGAGIPDEVGLALYKGEPVFLEDCDDMLALLSEISAQTWTYRDIRAVRLRNDRWNNPRLVSVTFRGE
ncbi:MAG: hypothetical protein JOZ71_13920 [Ktedonobacteraceae bacterium]|nr:hypothetical protein [Ktedonobacteraceae bacterium]